MKKRLMSILLTLCMLITMLPTTAWAEETTQDADIYIAGKGWKFEKNDDSTYKAVYYSANGQFMEDIGNWRTNAHLMLTKEGNTITITVKTGSSGGSSFTIDSLTKEIEYDCIDVKNSSLNLVIKGNGNTLNLNRIHSGNALSASGDITITDGVNVNATFKNKADGNYVARAIYAKTLTISGTNTEVTATDSCNSSTISVKKAINVADGAKLTVINDYFSNYSMDSYDCGAIGESYYDSERDLNVTGENSMVKVSVTNRYGKAFRHIAINAPDAIVKANDTSYPLNESSISEVLSEGYRYVEISIPETHTISSIVVTGLTRPVKGEAPVNKTNVSITEGMTIEDITWGPALTDGKFAANTAYTAVITYSIHNGYVLADDATCPAVADAEVTRWNASDMAANTIEVTFLPTEAEATESPVVIAGTTLLNDTYYTITNGSTVTVSDASNYNAYFDSATRTLKLNNADIRHSFAYEYGGGQDGAIIFKEFENYFIELSGENTISCTNTYAINCHRPDRTLTIKNAAGAENAKLTLTDNWTVICSIGGLKIQADVTMINTKEAGSLMYVNGTFSFDGYNAYASANASGSPLVAYTVPTTGRQDDGYQYLRVTKETLSTGDSHEHTYDDAIWTTDDTNHWHQCTDSNCPNKIGSIKDSAAHNYVNGACTICGKAGGTTEEHHFDTAWSYDSTDHWHKCTDEGCDAVSDKAPHAWVGWRVDEPYGTHQRFCNCGYRDYGHTYHLAYAADGENGHYQYCTTGNCTYKTSTVPHNYDGDTCTICGYTKTGGGEIVPPTPGGTIVIIVPAEEEPAPRPNPSTGALTTVAALTVATITRH